MKQKNIFLESEGNAYFERNAEKLRLRRLRLPESDSLLLGILDVLPERAEGTTVLEIGCGDGTRLNWLREHRGCVCSGVEPSAAAVDVARARGIDARQGTAERLPFDDQAFDIVTFGFCLYLCDREDLFRIAAEADRVLRNPGWLMIRDFYSPTPVAREYRHRPGVTSFKMDYRTLFTWNPAYTNTTHTVRHHLNGGQTDDRDEWVATSVLRKRL